MKKRKLITKIYEFSIIVCLEAIPKPTPASMYVASANKALFKAKLQQKYKRKNVVMVGFGVVILAVWCR